MLRFNVITLQLTSSHGSIENHKVDVEAEENGEKKMWHQDLLAYGFIPDPWDAELACRRFQVLGDKLKLSVVISAGRTTEVESRVRVLAVFLRGIKPGHLENGYLKTLVDGSAIAAHYVRGRIYEQTEHSARIFTHIKFDETYWTPSNHPTGNITYCCEFLLNGTLEASGCLRVQPRWMEEMLPKIGNIPLARLAIPGTHQSGTYFTLTRYEFQYRDCQEEDVFTQLLYGIRAFDLRPAAVAKGGPKYKGYEYWIFHSKFPTQNTVKRILQDIKSFLDIYRKEVVIVDFHEFPKGFDNSSSYEGLKELIDEVLGHHIYQKDKGAPSMANLDDVIELDQRAILTFDQNYFLQEEFQLGVRHIWADTDKISVLKEKLIEGTQERTPYRLLSYMAQLTAQDFWTVFFDRFRGGVRGLAHRDNFKITSWFFEDEVLRDYANIIAMDYFASSDIVDLCQTLNLERAERSQ